MLNNSSFEAVIEEYQWAMEGMERPLELDVFFPKELLAFEYQGEHHYFDVYVLGDSWNQKQRDQEKRELCLQNGITLIDVPYWWNFES